MGGSRLKTDIGQSERKVRRTSVCRLECEAN